MAQKKSYENWSKDLDQQVQALCGMSYQDLPDQPYHDWYDDGKSPKQAARTAVARAKRDMGF